MKKIIPLLILVLNIPILSFSQIKQVETGFYYLSDTPDNAELIKDIDSEDVFALAKRPAIIISDIKSIKIIQKNTSPKPIQLLEVKFKTAGTKKWGDLQKRISSTGESFVFVCNDKVYTQIYIFSSNEPSYKFELPIDQKYLVDIYHQLQKEISASR